MSVFLRAERSVAGRVAAALAIALMVLGGSMASAPAQNVPALATPDVTTLLAPGQSSSGDANAPAAGDQPPPPPPPCGIQPITIARMQWPSAALLAEIHARLLKAEFNCTVQVLPGDMAATTSSMATTGQPAVAPEMWISRVAEVWNPAVGAQKLRQVGLSYVESAFEGWYIPDYVASAHPELKSIADLRDNWQIFAHGGKKGRLVSCPADWGCAVINRNLLKANGLDQVYEVVEPGNRYELDQLIAEAVSGKQPILFYYWQPNAVLAQFSFKRLDLGPYDKDNYACLGKRVCDDPKPSGFVAEPVVIALAQWVFTGAPEIAAYFQRAAMPIKEMNALLAQLNAPGATVESVADKFIATREEIWRQWVGNNAP